MSTIRWKGLAPTIAQENTWTFAGTWLSTDTITVAFGAVAVATVTGSSTIATLLATLADALAGLSATIYPQFNEIAWGNTSTTLTATANTPGNPFTVTISTTSAAGTINSGTSSTGTVTTANGSPNDWSKAVNWSTGAVPVTGDNVYVENSGVSILYGLAQFGVTLASLNIGSTFTGTVGLGETNPNGYLEYRQQYLQVGATLIDIGYGSTSQNGPGSGRIKIDSGATATNLSCQLTGSGLESDIEPLQWKGTNAGNVITINRGTCALAGYAGDACTVATLNVGYMTNQSSDSTVRCGAGATLSTVLQSGGSLTIDSATTSIFATQGSLTIQGAGNNQASISLAQAALTYMSTGTIGTLTIGSGASADFSQDMRDRTISGAVQLQAGGSLTDPFGTVTFSGGIRLVQCGLPQVTLDVGVGRLLTPA